MQTGCLPVSACIHAGAAYALRSFSPVTYSFTLPITTPDTKYFWRNGYTSRIGTVHRRISAPLIPRPVTSIRCGFIISCSEVIFVTSNFRSTASRLPVALRSSASAKLYQKWSKTPELRGFRGFSFSNGLTQFDRTKPLLTRFLWVKWWTTTPKRGLMG